MVTILRFWFVFLSLAVSLSCAGLASSAQENKRGYYDWPSPYPCRTPISEHVICEGDKPTYYRVFLDVEGDGWIECKACNVPGIFKTTEGHTSFWAPAICGAKCDAKSRTGWEFKKFLINGVYMQNEAINAYISVPGSILKAIFEEKKADAE